jgi:hypothetical protein
VGAEAIRGVGEENRPGRCPAGSTADLRACARSGVLKAGLRPGRIGGEAGGLDRAAGEGEERGVREVEDDRNRGRDGGGEDCLVVEEKRVLGEGDAEGRAMRRKRENLRFRSRKLKV